MILVCVILGALAVIAFTCAAIVDVRIFEDIKKMEDRFDRADKELDLLLNNDSQLSMNITRLSERVDMAEDKANELEKKFDNQQNNVAAQVAEKVEKIWDAGLEKMMSWNPYDTGSADGGN